MSGMALQHKPEWFRVRLPSGDTYEHVRGILKSRNLATVCEEAHCPNIAECWGGGTATIMLMGDTCTRGCRFCAVTTGNPHKILDEWEPIKVAEAIGELGLTYIVLTSVCRDDLPDGGAEHFGRTVREIRGRHPHIIVEVLIPDFRGDPEAIKTIVASRPQVIGHNIETIERLSPVIRDWRAAYRQSLDVLRSVKEIDPTRFTKSSVMLGLGETDDEVKCTMRDLRNVGVDILTLGQYLQPSRTWRHIPAKEYVNPKKFDEWRIEGEKMGFRYVASGPLVRSSYRAGEFFLEKLIQEHAPTIRFPTVAGV